MKRTRWGGGGGINTIRFMGGEFMTGRARVVSWSFPCVLTRDHYNYCSDSDFLFPIYFWQTLLLRYAGYAQRWAV